MAGNTTEWIAVSDFTPGIFGDFHGAGGTGNPGSSTRGAIMRDGAATIEHTYGCRADRSGALVPLPKRTAGKQQTLLPGGNANATTSYYPTGYIGAYLLDACLVQVGLTSPTDTWVFTLWSFLYSTGGTGASYKEMVTGMMYRMPAGTTSSFFWESSDPNTTNTAIPITSGSLCASRGTTAATYPLDMQTFERFVAICYENSTLAGLHAAAGIVAAEAAITTYDTDVSANYPRGTLYANGLTTFPDITSGAPASVKFLTSVAGNALLFAPLQVIEHQGRLVGASRLGAQMWVSSSLEPLIGYTRVNDPNVLASGGTSGGLYQNRGLLEGFGGMASLTADELFLLGHNGGALVVRGDINNPTVAQLPFVESTYGVATHLAITPLGVVYGSRNGIFAWSGGDTSTKLSAQLEGMFWDHAVGAESYLNTRGRLCWWHPWVCVPNGFLFDTDTESWWRLTDPTANSTTPYNIFAVDPSTGVLYAFPYKLTATQNTVYDTYTPSTLAASFSWRSQPLVQSRERLVTIQQVELVASNPTATDSTVTVTVEGIDEAGVLTSRTVTFTLTGTGTSGGRPQIIRQSLTSPDSGLTQGSITARYIQFRIEASNATVAPKIMSIGMGVTDRASVATT